MTVKIDFAEHMNPDSEYKEDLSFRAMGRFSHSGVAAHPGDKGMEKIARIIWDNLKKLFEDFGSVLMG